jgi:hypothetical protein
MKHWHKSAIVFSVAWIVLLALYVGVPAYHQFACTPSVETSTDGTIVRHSCLHSPVSWPFVRDIGMYCFGGFVVILALSWIFLGWPSELVANYFGLRRKDDSGQEYP